MKKSAYVLMGFVLFFYFWGIVSLPVEAAEPKWPQSFMLQEGAETSFMFEVEKPGPVVVTVQWAGRPLLVSLLKPNGGALERQGTGSVTLNYEAAATDVQMGKTWRVRLRCVQQQSSKSVKPVRQALKAQGILSVQHPLGAPSLQPVKLNDLLPQIPTVQTKSQPVTQPQTAVGQIPVNTPAPAKGRVFKAESLTRELAHQLQDNDLIEYQGKQYTVGALRSGSLKAEDIDQRAKPTEAKDDSFKLGNKTFDKKDRATEEMTGASKGFSDEQAFKEKMKDLLNQGIGGIGGGTSLEDASKQFGNVGGHDIPGQNKGGAIFDDGKGTGPNTGGLTGNIPGPKDAMGGGGAYLPTWDGEIGGFVNIDSMGGVTAGAKGGVSGNNWNASGSGSYNFGGKSWEAHGDGSYGGVTVGGTMTGGANQGTKGSVSGSYKGVGTNSNQVGGFFSGKSGADKNTSSPGDYKLRNNTPVDPSNTQQGLQDSGKKDNRGDYNTKDNSNDKQGNDANKGEKPPKEDPGTATTQPAGDGTNDTGGNREKYNARVKAAARQFTGGTGGMGESGWGDKPGANDAQRQTIHPQKANNEAASVLGIGKKDTEGDPNTVNTQAYGPGASQGVSTDKEILSPTTQPK